MAKKIKRATIGQRYGLISNPRRQRMYIQLLRGYEENAAIMHEMCKIFPVSIKEAKKKYPELNFKPIESAINKYCRINMTIQAKLGVTLPDGKSPVHLLRWAIRTGVNPTATS